VCTILDMRQSDFVVRAEEKSLSWLQQTSKAQPAERLVPYRANFSWQHYPGHASE
jgi:hypothetical protein